MMHRFHHHWMPGGDGFGWWHSMLLSTVGTLFLVALFIGLALAFMKWVLPLLNDIFSRPVEERSSLEILRRRYAEGAIDADTFEQMRERLEASYQHSEPEASTWEWEKLPHMR